MRLVLIGCHLVTPLLDFKGAGQRYLVLEHLSRVSAEAGKGWVLSPVVL
jgi:hypothetical protein